jgi:iron complex transport system substrate-binding protein
VPKKTRKLYWTQTTIAARTAASPKEPASMPRLLLAALLLACTSVHAQLLVNDDAGRPLLVRQHFKRIVTLAPFLTEAAFAAGAGDLVVAVDQVSDYPREATRLPRVPTGAHFSLDSLAEYKPDLVLAWKDGLRMEDVDAISSFGATVYLAQPRRLEDVPRLMEAIGALTGRNVSEPITSFVTRVNEIRRANAAKPKLQVFLETWDRPLTTVGGASVLSEAVAMCRGDNVFAELRGIAPQVSFEEVRQMNPYVIIGVNSASNVKEFENNWAPRRGITAVQAGRLIYIESESLQRPTVRSLDSVARLCQELDQVRLRDQLIAPSEAFVVRSGPLASNESTAPTSDVLRRPMTAIERDVAAVLASSYAVGKETEPAKEASPPKAAQAAAPSDAQGAAPDGQPAAGAAAPVTLAAAEPTARATASHAALAGAAPGSPGSYTQVSRYGDLYFVSGQIALDPETGAFDPKSKIDAQTVAALENVRRALEGEKLTLANVVSATVYLRTISDLDAMDAAYETAFRTRLPARTVVETRNLPRGARVQISVVAGR